MNLRGIILAAGLLSLAACGDEPTRLATPREPGPEATGYYCRMALSEHKGPKGQILPRGWQKPLWFSSVRDAFTYMDMELISEQEITGFWVNDMAQGTWDAPAPGSWIDARTAWYVVGSRMSAGMGGAEAVPFRDRSAAEDFSAAHGGQIADYQAARRTLAEMPASAPSAEGGET